MARIIRYLEPGTAFAIHMVRGGRLLRSITSWSGREIQMRAPDKTLDVQGVAGLRVKVLALQTLELMERGQVLQVITAGRDSTKVIASLCRDEGYLLLDEILDGPRHSFLIQR